MRRGIGPIEAMALEFDGHCREDLSNLSLTATRADGDRIVVERLLLREIVLTVPATVMIGRQGLPPLILMTSTTRHQ